jgi:hypothetical protein
VMNGDQVRVLQLGDGASLDAKPRADLRRGIALVALPEEDAGARRSRAPLPPHRNVPRPSRRPSRGEFRLRTLSVPAEALQTPTRNPLRGFPQGRPERLECAHKPSSLGTAKRSHRMVR